jgi:hypothetical protein
MKVQRLPNATAGNRTDRTIPGEFAWLHRPNLSGLIPPIPLTIHFVNPGKMDRSRQGQGTPETVLRQAQRASLYMAGLPTGHMTTRVLLHGDCPRRLDIADTVAAQLGAETIVDPEIPQYLADRSTLVNSLWPLAKDDVRNVIIITSRRLVATHLPSHVVDQFGVHTLNVFYMMRYGQTYAATPRGCWVAGGRVCPVA